MPSHPSGPDPRLIACLRPFAVAGPNPILITVTVRPDGTVGADSDVIDADAWHHGPGLVLQAFAITMAAQPAEWFITIVAYALVTPAGDLAVLDQAGRWHTTITHAGQ